MHLTFNLILKQANIEPSNVRLLRHQDTRAGAGRAPYHLWRQDLKAFEQYQANQDPANRSRLQPAAYWASFVGTPYGETLFVGLYLVNNGSALEPVTPSQPLEGGGSIGLTDVYNLERDTRFSAFEGKLVLDWGKGKRSWIQRADKRDKIIVELRAEIREPEFPGHLKFVSTISEMCSLPVSWVTALKQAHGIYLLTCPRTKEIYVGMADGEGGFWQRWENYSYDGHGGNLGLKSRDPSDYQVTILEVAGSSTSRSEIAVMEQVWKRKLQSQVMGLNRN
tara:strand:- start:9608 stop:10444 length:837 start_codon:yes stop_codon:yes gene_type:complete